MVTQLAAVIWRYRQVHLELSNWQYRSLHVWVSRHFWSWAWSSFSAKMLKELWTRKGNTIPVFQDSDPSLCTTRRKAWLKVRIEEINIGWAQKPAANFSRLHTYRVTFFFLVRHWLTGETKIFTGMGKRAVWRTGPHAHYIITSFAIHRTLNVQPYSLSSRPELFPK